MKLKSTLFIVIFLFSIFLCYAAPPFQTTVQTDNLLNIQFPLIDYYSLNTDLNFNFHIYNSTGYILTNSSINCTYHLYSQNGSHLITKLLSYDTSDKDFYINIDKGNFTKEESYSFLVYCYGIQGGFLSSVFEVTSTGKETGKLSDNILFVSIALFLVIFLASLIFIYTRMETKEHSFYKAFLFFMILLFGLISLFAGYIIIINSTVVTNLKTMIEISTITFGGLIILVSLGYWLWYAIESNIKKTESEDDE